MSIYERLRDSRTKLGLSQSEAATKFCIGLSSYKKYEAGSSEPGSSALAGISNAGVNANWLLTGKGDMFLGNNCAETAASYEISAKLISGVDCERLALAIEIVEELLDEQLQKMQPKSKAEAIRLAYQIFEEEDEGKDANSFNSAKKILARIIKSML